MSMPIYEIAQYSPKVQTKPLVNLRFCLTPTEGVGKPLVNKRFCLTTYYIQSILKQYILVYANCN